MKLQTLKIFILLVNTLLISGFVPQSELAKKTICLNPAYSFKERAADLVSRVTPEEKQSQLDCHIL